MLLWTSVICLRQTPASGLHKQRIECFKMNKDEILSILNNKDTCDIKEFTADIARKLTTIYENDHGYKGLYFCMLTIIATDNSSRKTTENHLKELLKDLNDSVDSLPHHVATIESMLCAAQATLIESKDGVLSKSVESIQHAFTAANHIPEITEKLLLCIERWKDS